MSFLEVVSCAAYILRRQFAKQWDPSHSVLDAPKNHITALTFRVFNEFHFIRLFSFLLTLFSLFDKESAQRRRCGHSRDAVEVIKVCFILAIISVTIIAMFAENTCARVYRYEKILHEISEYFRLDFAASRELSRCHRRNRAKTQRCMVHRTSYILFPLFMGMQCTSISRCARRRRARAINFWQTQKLFLRITRIDFRATSDPLPSAAL